MDRNLNVDQESRDTIKNVFSLICNIPYGNVGKRCVRSAVQMQRGSCSSKHQLLFEILSSMGLEVRKMMGECDLKKFGELLEPPIILKETTRDFHNYLEVKFDGKWIVLDATFGINEEKHGLSSNMRWDGYTDCSILFPLKFTSEIDDIFLSKERAIELLGEKEKENRKNFFRDLTLRLSGAT